MKALGAVNAFLAGKKTYLICLIALAVIVANGLELIDVELRDSLLTLLGVGGVASLRHGISK